MPNTMEKTKIKRSDFEHKLVTIFGVTNIFASPYAERGFDTKGNEKYTKMTLYYQKGTYRMHNGEMGNKHIGTWSNGFGWIF